MPEEEEDAEVESLVGEVTKQSTIEVTKVQQPRIQEANNSKYSNFITPFKN